MSFRKFIPPCRVASPSSSPPAPFVCTPPNGTSEPRLLPSPPASTSSQRSQKQEDLVWRALEFINNRFSETPGIVLGNFSWADFDDFEVELKNPCHISRKSAESLRFDYNPETLTLRISPMPKAAHDELEDFLRKSMTRFVLRNIITEAEDDQLHVGSSTDIKLPYRATTAQVGRKAPAFAKQPDAFIRLKDNGESMFPRVIFEVGFSQTYEEVMDDVRQWLVRSEGEIPLVVLIFIEEHPIPARPDVADVDMDGNDQDSDDSADSDVAMYRRLRLSCNVDDHVGPLSAFAELFRLGPAGVFRVGARINIISPPGITPPVPAGHIQLSITDLLPDVVDGRVLDFDLARYAHGLELSRGCMALPRMLEERRARQRAAARVKAADANFEPAVGLGRKRKAV